MGFWIFICLGVIFVLFMVTFLYFMFKKNFILKKKSKSEPYEVPQEILEKVKGKNGVMLDCGSKFNTKLIDLKQNIECTEVSSVKGDYTIDCITNKFYRLKFDIKNNSGKLKIDLYI